MTQEIIEMAVQAGYDEHQAKFDTRITAFAKLVASEAIAKEREACAQICLNAAAHLQKFSAGGLACCEAIRARGGKA